MIAHAQGGSGARRSRPRRSVNRQLVVNFFRCPGFRWINTCEHFTVHGFAKRTFAVANPWFSGSAKVSTFTISELLATKLRALYQRKKGRDLFDLRLGLEHPEVDLDQLVAAFEQYMAYGETPVTRAQFEANMAAKLVDPTFLGTLADSLRLHPGRTIRRMVRVTGKGRAVDEFTRSGVESVATIPERVLRVRDRALPVRNLADLSDSSPRDTMKRGRGRDGAEESDLGVSR